MLLEVLGACKLVVDVPSGGSCCPENRFCLHMSIEFGSKQTARDESHLVFFIAQCRPDLHAARALLQQGLMVISINNFTCAMFESDADKSQHTLPSGSPCHML